MVEAYHISAIIRYESGPNGTVEMWLDDTGKHIKLDNIQIRGLTGHIDLIECLDSAQKWLTSNGGEEIRVEEV